MTKLLFDVLTPKQARIAAVLHVEGRRRGIEVVVTCREYMHVEDMLKMYNVPHLCVGKYGKTAYEKLVFGLERQLGLVEVAKGVGGMLSFPSPDAARVVFGLGKPLVVLNDTPHAVHVNRLVLPLSDVLIAPSAIPTEEWARYCPRRVVTFDGVFEYTWISRFKPSASTVESLGLTPGQYVVFRPEESHAAYYRWNSASLRRRLMKLAAEMGYQVVNVPRYDDQVEEGVVNLTRAVDHLDLAYFAAAVVSGGATMATEAALLGVPALSYFPEDYYIDRYLQERGAPLFRCKDEEGCVKALRDALKSGRATPPRLEDPTGLIFEVVKDVVR